MAELSENNKFNISVKTLGGISALIFTLVCGLLYKQI